MKMDHAYDRDRAVWIALPITDGTEMEADS